MERLFLRSQGFEIARNAVIALGLGVLTRLAIARWGHVIGQRLGNRQRRHRLAAAVWYFILSRVPIVPIDTDVLRQVLLTVGFAFLFQQAALDIWGGDNMDINPPPRSTPVSSSAASISRSIACS